jgi:hypothetical protein
VRSRSIGISWRRFAPLVAKPWVYEVKAAFMPAEQASIDDLIAGKGLVPAP